MGVCENPLDFIEYLDRLDSIDYRYIWTPVDPIIRPGSIYTYGKGWNLTLVASSAHTCHIIQVHLGITFFVTSKVCHRTLALGNHLFSNQTKNSLGGSLLDRNAGIIEPFSDDPSASLSNLLGDRSLFPRNYENYQARMCGSGDLPFLFLVDIADSYI